MSLNPTLDASIVASAQESDAFAARSEWLGEFRDDVGAFLDDALINAAIECGRPLELPRREGLSYKAFVDASGGRGDHYTCAVGCRNKDERFTIAGLRGHAPPFDPSLVTKELAEWVKSYGCHQVTGDNYSGEWVQKAWQQNGVSSVVSELSRSEIYLEVLPLFTQGVVSLPDHPRLTRELRLLERRTHRSGKDVVDHGRAGSDDYSNGVCGLLYNLSKRRYRYDSTLSWVS